jgi:hypothetical protein
LFPNSRPVQFIEALSKSALPQYLDIGLTPRELRADTIWQNRH